MKQIFVMGGGGFAMEPDNLLLDKFILSLSMKTLPKICFLGTASGDAENYRQMFFDAYRTLPCTPDYFSLFKPSTRDIESFILSQDIIHVGGGNTKNLLCLWREWGLDKILFKAYENGVVLSGISAGMLCWFEEGITDSYGDGLAPIKALGMLKGSACPHFDGEAQREPSYTRFIQNGSIQGGIALDDGTGALYIDGKLDSCVSSRKSARGFMIETKTAHKKELPVRFLGSTT
jgi:peptidase E